MWIVKAGFYSIATSTVPKAELKGLFHKALPVPDHVKGD
jgi:hypothetical protein